MVHSKDLHILRLGEPKIDSPLKGLLPAGCQELHFISDRQKVVFDLCASAHQKQAQSTGDVPALELAGPREKIFFDPNKTSAAMVTCGGLCPGLNDVIRSLVMTLYYRYGVKRILGIPFGFQGFIEKVGHQPIELTPEVVTEIHKTGGTILGTSRGRQDKEAIVDFLMKHKIDILFVIGGDGTLRGALAIASMIKKRKVKISIIGIPKTVDNDILYIDRSFGFATATSIAVQAITTAHSEAISQTNGIGLVKLMGRHSGFITCFAALGTNDANFVLIAEVPFDLEGDKGFLKALEDRLNRRGHAVILVSEGAGQQHMKKKSEKDASGNIRLADVGLFLKDKINSHFKQKKLEVNLKYIDPSYVIRAVEASADDSYYCLRLGQHAVHAAMSGRTTVVVGLRHNQYVHFPMELIASGRRRVDPTSDLWLSVLEATGQPAEMINQP